MIEVMRDDANDKFLYEGEDKKSLPTWSIVGLDASGLMTIHRALAKERDEAIEYINRYTRAEKAAMVYVSETQDFRPAKAEDVAKGTYEAAEDLLFVAEELRKVSELMFRIKTTEGVF